MSLALADPIAYAPELERAGPDEAEAIALLREDLLRIQRIVARDHGEAMRGVHAKAHAIVRGRLHVRADLPAHLAQGLFAAPNQYDALLRFSTNPGDVLDDAISVPRGLAFKLSGVAGERLPDAPEPGTQDFLLANGPVFGAADALAFHRLLRLLAFTTDRGEGAKKLLSRALGRLQHAFEATGHRSPLLGRLGGAPNVHPLGETYFSQTAYRFGQHVAKFRLEPESDALRAWTGAVVDTTGRPDALREELAAILRASGGTWTLAVQLCRDPVAMPVEDPTVLWRTDLSPFEPVAALVVPPQVSWMPGPSDELDRQIAFNPWNGLAAHRPLGGINRARRLAYQFSADFRAAFNGEDIHRAVPPAEAARAVPQGARA